MAVLSTLKLVTAVRTNIVDPVQQRRNKLIQKLDEQLQMAQAKQAGTVYAPIKLRTVTDEATGETKTVQVQKRVREWFWNGDAGKINLTVKYGAATLYLNAKNATAIELNNLDELVSVIKSLKVAAAEGEFDKAITSASKATREGFGK